MADSEKLTALKKAYADTILNTAKEAAARIMMSERKALQYQQELFATKDESLRMLLRLKQMLDFKVNEAEMTSLSQKKRIDELEAQLGEAEDIVKDLRAELIELQDELEKLTNHQMPVSNEDSMNGHTVAPVKTLPENRLDTFCTVKTSRTDAQPELVPAPDIKSSVLNGRCEIRQCCNKDNCHTCDSDFSSIVMRGKEPELYRNGCTQRIRALESSPLNGNFSISGKTDDRMNESSVRDNSEGKDRSIEVHNYSENICTLEDNQDNSALLRLEETCSEAHAVSASPNQPKRVIRYRNKKQHPDQIEDTCETFDSFYSGASLSPVSNNAGSGESPQIMENNREKDPESPLASKPFLDTFQRDTQTGCEDFERESDQEIATACTAQKNEKSLVEEMDLRSQESESAENLEVPASNKKDPEANDLPSISSDVKPSDLCEENSALPISNKFLKYTFRRKRKRDLFSSPDRNSSLDETTKKKKSVEEQSCYFELESQKPTLLTESTQQGQQLALVAQE